MLIIVKKVPDGLVSQGVPALKPRLELYELVKIKRWKTVSLNGFTPDEILGKLSIKNVL